MTSSVPFTVEDVHQGWPNQPILYRIRIPARGTGTSHPSQVIRYLTAPNLPKGASGIPDFRGELLAFDAVPAGDWNLGRLVVPRGDSAAGNFILASTEMAQLEEAAGLLDAGPVWRDRKVDLVDLLDALDSNRKSEIKSKNKNKSDQADDDDDDDDDQDDVPHNTTDIQCTNHVSAAALPTPTPADMSTVAVTTGPEVIAIWTWQPGHAHGIANESNIYATIQARDPDLAPRFLGHITGNGGARVIGFLLERVTGAREAGPADLERCRESLSRLHGLGIAHGGPLKRHSFLVCSGGGGDDDDDDDDDVILLQGFGGSFETTDTDREVLDRELEGLERVLAQRPSELEASNAPIDVELSNRLVEFQSHGLTHPFVHRQLADSGRATLTVEQHRGMVAELVANDYRWTEEDMERAKQRFGGS
ncbi:putative alpha-galactosidase a precursor protein [Eutypa lata UCREL1]|uniref:Putative alpha-galactosidase a protein n=1 Tax=Eutypa lata (strain UCR-EL1) TaxID=1287681 RepID=M7T473_EUTLA|nr:putative alpha-galactosidase a precursor protein [Eutypa lata UCREL1]